MHRDPAETRQTDHVFTLDDLDYALPESLVAQEPVPKRDGSRLLVLDRRTNAVLDDCMANLPKLLNAGDLLVVNDTKVMPAKFLAHRKTGGKIPGLFLMAEPDSIWSVMLQGSRRLHVGEFLTISAREGGDVTLELLASLAEGQWRIRVHGEGTTEQILERIGRAPLPPYIRRAGETDPRDAVDRARYQTIFARQTGAVAAPTAGLHFTETLLEQVQAIGVDVASVTLHVGLGTFKPIAVESIELHSMHTERYELSEETAQAINACKRRGGRVVAVGTTSVRVLETVASVAAPDGPIEAALGATDLFIYPPHRFRAVDALLTNFHLPHSTLLALVMAFAGVDFVKRAYHHAVEQKYRFFSYGDAMFITKAPGVPMPP